MRRPWILVPPHSSWILATMLLGCLLACSRETSDKAVSTQEQPLAYFPQTASTRTLCAGTAAGDLGVTIPARIWISSKLEQAGLEHYTQLAGEILGHYGLRFVQKGPVERFTQDPLIVADNADQQNDLFAMTRPLRELLQHIEADGSLHIVFAERILAPHHSLQASLSHASGFALSPHYRVVEDREVLGELIGRPLEELPGPIVLLGLEELALIEPQRRFDTLAHEIGHALGLEHSGGREMLMSPIRHTHCDAGFSQSELDALRSTWPSSEPALR